jgi:hypothetical protein
MKSKSRMVELLAGTGLGGNMAIAPELQPADSSRGTGTGWWRENMAEAIRFWEPLRIAYNLLLTSVVILWVLGTWPRLRGVLGWASLLPLGVLALLANVCYCAAYLVDIPIQRAKLTNALRKWRWVLWVAGTLLAIVLANYWIADEILADFP